MQGGNRQIIEHLQVAAEDCCCCCCCCAQRQAPEEAVAAKVEAVVAMEEALEYQ